MLLYKYAQVDINDSEVEGSRFVLFEITQADPKISMGDAFDMLAVKHPFGRSNSILADATGEYNISTAYDGRKVKLYYDYRISQGLDQAPEGYKRKTVTVG